eukprot:506387_1
MEGFMYSIEIDNTYKIEIRINPPMKLLESQNKYNEMIELANKLLIKNPKAVGILSWKGVGLKGLNQMTECIKCFEKAVELQPQNEMIFTLYCAVLMENKNWNKFLEVNKKMIELRPTAGSYHNNYIQALENLNEKDKANQHVNIILDKYGPVSPSINFICGDYYYKHQIFDKAEICLQKAAQLDFKNKIYQKYYIRSLLQNGKENQADKYCQLLISKDPKNVMWVNTIGYICFDAFDFKSAAKHFKQCIEMDPNDPLNVTDYCMVLCELGELNEAEKLVTDLLNKNPNFISGQYRLARIFEYKNKYKEAEDIYLKIIKINPMKGKMNMAYGHLLYLMGKYEESMKYFKIAEKVDGSNPWFYFWYGLLLINDKYKQYNNAIKSFEKCLKLQATHHKCHYEYACLLYNILAKNKSKAIYHMKQAMDIDIKNEKYKKILKEFEDNYDPKDDDDMKDDIKQDGLNDNDDNDDDEKDRISVIRKKEYIFKSIDNENKCIVVFDDDFKDIIFKLDGLNINEIKNINDKIEEGAKNKQDVKIVVVETQSQNQKITQKVSHAKI